MLRLATRVLSWAPALLAVIFVITGLVSESAIRDSLNAQADFASTPVIAQLMSSAPHGSTVLLGDYPWYEALWLLRATIWLPWHFAVWQLIPFAIWIAVAALAACTVRRAAGAWAASITASMIICAGVSMRGTLWSLNTHGPAAFHAALLAAALVFALRNQRWLGGLRGWGGALVLGLITAVGLTDPLVAAVGVAPLLVTTFALWARGRVVAPFRLSVFVSLVAVVGSRVMIHLAHSDHIVWTMRKQTFVAPDQVVTHLGLLPGAIGVLTAADEFGAPIGLKTAIPMIAGLAALFAGVIVLHAGVRQSKRGLWPERFTPAASAATDEVPAADDLAATDERSTASADAANEEATRELVWMTLTIFWTTVIVMTLLAWTFTSSPFDIYGARYLVSGWVGVCVLIPLLAVKLDLRWLAALTATVICFGATFQFVRAPGPTAGEHLPKQALASTLRKFADAHHVTHGFAGFWDAMPITWHTRFGLKLYPIWACPATPPSGNLNCAFYEHQISSWYTPSKGPTMLVTDSSVPLSPAVDPNYGKPTAVLHDGNVTAYVYPTDIAANLN